jgi:tetratricopeptide (TPR) repeat protein
MRTTPKQFDHPDPVHNSPSSEEIASLARWGEAHAEYKRGHFERALELCPLHSYALTQLAQDIVRDDDEARRRAVELLDRALRCDPHYFDANLRMGWNCVHLGRYEDARRHIARAERHGPLSARQLSAVGDAYADWGFLFEAERLFQRALVREPDAPRILRNYARAVWDLEVHTPEQTERALALFERALAAGPNDHVSHFYLAQALASVPGAAARALQHAERALALVPGHQESAELAARLQEALLPDETVHVVRKILPTQTFLRGSRAPS